MSDDPVALAEAALARIEAREPSLHAYAHLDRAATLAEAERLRACGADGPLAGYAVAVKDIFDTWDFPTECGSPIYAGRRPGRDAAAVAAVRAAGGLVVGKSVTTEFAHMTAGPTANPHDEARTPGGSSSGSAATVAAGGADLALGTQTAGSIIRPAAYCGVVGYKPTFGTISRSGLALFAESLDTIGGFARDVAGAARLVGAMAGRADLVDAMPAAAPPTIAIDRTPDASLAEPAALDVLEGLAGAAARAGARVLDVTGMLAWAELQGAQTTVMEHEGARALLPERQRHGDLLSPALRTYLDAGIAVDGEARLAALRRAEAGRGRLAEIMAGVDVLVTLSVQGEAPLRESGTGNPHFNRVWSLLGGPCLHLPTSVGPLGLRLGVQLVAPWHADRQLIEAALWLERCAQG